MEAAKPFVLFVLGGPGAGKGTLCATLVEKNGFVHLSAGDLLRAERKKGTENAQLINDKIANGEIVPVEITVNLIKDAMVASGWEKAKFLIDGFPRNQDNVDGWTTVIGDTCEVKGILYLKCTEATMRARILQRGASSGRIDDKEEVILKRFNTYKNSTYPVIVQYGKNGGKVFEIDCEGTKDVVYQAVVAILTEIN